MRQNMSIHSISELEAFLKSEKKLYESYKKLEQALELEAQDQYLKTIDAFTKLIQTLYASPLMVEGNIIDKEIIRSCIDIVLKKTGSLHHKVQLQEELDRIKAEYLKEENFFHEFWQLDSDQQFKVQKKIQQNDANEITSNVQFDDIYKKFRININQNLISGDDENSLHIRPVLTPPELIHMPIRPIPPVSLSLTRGTTDKKLTVEQMELNARGTFLNRQSTKLGIKLISEVSQLVRYMLSTGIRTSIVKFMGLDDQQLDFSETKKKYVFGGIPNIDDSLDQDDPRYIYKAKYSFKFYDYSFHLFRQLRKINSIDCDFYVHSLAADPDGNSLEDMLSEGKSAANFFRSSNGYFVIKTLSESEFQFLLQLLPKYVNLLTQTRKYVNERKDTLLTRFYGIHKLQPFNENPLYFLVMENLIPLSPGITRYDLKGSTYGRSATAEEIQEGGVLKDLDFRVPFILGAQKRTAFYNQLKSDCTFLEENSIMDYSLLVGIEQRQLSVNQIQLLQSNSQFKEDEGGFRGTGDNNCKLNIVYYVGIIDILQHYNIRKKVEHALKSITESSTEISCVDPITYSTRFQNFIKDNTASAMSEHNNGLLSTNISLTYGNIVPPS